MEVDNNLETAEFKKEDIAKTLTMSVMDASGTRESQLIALHNAFKHSIKEEEFIEEQVKRFDAIKLKLDKTKK